MLIVIDDPKGIDVPIRKLQEKLHSSLMDAWGLDTSIEAQNALYESYGRCYRNKKGNGNIAEVYAGAGEYKEVYWNDALSAISFFGISNNIKHDKTETVDVHLIFFVNILKLKPSLPNRADEEIRLDVQNTFQSNLFGFHYLSTDLWLENVLREYAGSYRDQRLKAVDMHPVHCFRLNFALIYNKKNCF